MKNLTKIMSATLLSSMFVGCAAPSFKIPEVPNLGEFLEEVDRANEEVFEGLKEMEESIALMERPEYTGTDSVGAVNASNLYGTWRVDTVNKAPAEPNIGAIITLKADGSFDANSNYDFGSALGKVSYDMVGTWTVEDEFFSMTITSATETTGNELVASVDDGEFEVETDVFNVYESEADYWVVYDEATGRADSYTRVQ